MPATVVMEQEEEKAAMEEGLVGSPVTREEEAAAVEVKALPEEVVVARSDTAFWLHQGIPNLEDEDTGGAL